MPRMAATQEEKSRMAEDSEKPYVCKECGIAYSQQMLADACGNVDLQLSYRRQIGL